MALQHSNAICHTAQQESFSCRKINEIVGTLICVF
jgi:hypothetical protein